MRDFCSTFSPERSRRASREFWHFGFFRSSFAEMLIQGREAEFFRAFAFADFVYQESAFSESDIDEYVQNQVRPGRLAAGFDYYRALASSKEFFEKTVAPPWGFPVLAVDGDHSMSGLTARSFARIQPGLKSMLIPDCGHFVQKSNLTSLSERSSISPLSSGSDGSPPVSGVSLSGSSAHTTVLSRPSRSEKPGDIPVST